MKTLSCLTLIAAILLTNVNCSTYPLPSVVDSGYVGSYQPRVSANTLTILNDSEVELYFAEVAPCGRNSFCQGIGIKKYRLLPRKDNKASLVIFENVGSGLHYFKVWIPGPVEGGLIPWVTYGTWVNPPSSPVYYAGNPYYNLAVISAPHVFEIVKPNGFRIQWIERRYADYYGRAKLRVQNVILSLTADQLVN